MGFRRPALLLPAGNFPGNLRHPAGDGPFIFLPAAALFRPRILCEHFHRNPAALTTDLFQDPDQLRAAFMDDHRIRHFQPDPAPFQERKLRIFEDAVFHGAAFFQLQQDAVIIGLQQFWRIVLGGKMEFLLNFNGDIATGKKLIFDLLFHLEDYPLFDEPVTADVNPDKILLPCGGYPLHIHLIEQRSVFFFQIQPGKYFRKMLCHLSSLSPSNVPARSAARKATPPPAPCARPPPF